MKIAIVTGTRPEIIKMSPIIRELDRRGMDYCVIHTGQHFSWSLAGVFFRELGLPSPAYTLDIGIRPSGCQTGAMISRLSQLWGGFWGMNKPQVVLVEGDTNSVLAGAVAASKLGIKVGHVEAGLRSYNRAMQEEINRVLTDHCSDLLFAPTELARNNLLTENINKDWIFVTGNTIVDALYSVVASLDGSKPYDEPYALVTIHRAENVDDKGNFALILESLRRVGRQMPVVYPAHPRALEMAEKHGLKFDGITVVEPQGYLDFLRLEKNAKVVLTDSGGVQEEACVLGVPCVTLRDETERPETLEVGANMVAGIAPDGVVRCVEIMCGKPNNWANPFGDGKAGERIVDIIGRQYG